MSGGGSSGGSSRWPQFTAAQWQELEHQALIFKYLKAGVSVPPDLLAPIHRSLESISARFLQYPTLGYYSFYGKKIDPEPGRCRRTDGKKWRCSKDSHPESKYCERHMNRGRHRSRKPVESQTASSLSLPTPPALDVGGIGSSSSGGSRIFQNLPINSNSANSSFGSHSSQLQVETTPYGSCNNNKYSEPKPQAEINKSVVQTSSIARGFPPLHGVGSVGIGGYSSSLQKQHYFFGSSPTGTEKLEQPFFETRAFLDSQRSDMMSSFSSTQLSMGIDKDPSMWLERDSASPNDNVEGNMRNFQA